MANKVTFKIGSQFDPKGVNDAKTGLQGIGQTAQSSAASISAGYLKAAAIITGAIIAVKKLKSAFDGIIEAYTKQQDAEIRLAAAARNNPLINGQAVNSLKEYASAIQAVTRYGDEEIIQQEQFLVTLGMSEEQIKRVMLASVNLASTGMVSLESATRNIAKTFGGMTGELGELIPTLKDLTIEQLKAGDAVAFINRAYGGMAEAAAKGIGGARDQIKNIVGDIKEQLGQIGYAIWMGAGGGGLKAVFGRISQWIADNRDRIINFFLNLPEIAGEAALTMRNIMARVLTFDFIADAWSQVLTYQFDQLKRFGETAWAFIKAIGTTLWEPLKLGFEWMVYGIKSAWHAVVTFIGRAIDTLLIPINAMLQGLESIVNGARNAGAAIQAFIQHPFDSGKREALRSQLQSQIPGANLGRVGFGGFDLTAPTAPENTFQKIQDAWTKALQEGGAYLKSNFEHVANLVSILPEEFGDDFKDLMSVIDRILGRELPDDLKLALEPLKDLADAVGALTQPGGPFSGAVIYGQEGREPGIPYVGAREGYEIPGGEGDEMSAFANSFGEVGQMIAGTFDPIMALVAGLAKMLEQITALRVVMAPILPLFEIIGRTIAPIANQVLAPLVGMLVVFGTMIGSMLIPVFKILSPVIELVAQGFLWLYNNVFRHVGNLIIGTFNVLALAVTAIVNGIIAFINLFLPKGKRIAEKKGPAVTEGFLEKISYQDMMDEAASYMTEQGADLGGGVYGGSTTVQRQPDIYVHIYNNGNINGAGGLEEFGHQCALAIQEFALNGGQLIFMEN